MLGPRYQREVSVPMIAWLATHLLDVILHLGLDVTGGLTLRCAMGMCQHKRHQYIVWGIGCVLISLSTVALIG